MTTPVSSDAHADFNAWLERIFERWPDMRRYAATARLETVYNRKAKQWQTCITVTAFDKRGEREAQGMKPNSCLYRAVDKVIRYQFGITDLSSVVFDRYNNGDGVPTKIMVTVINEALADYGVCVDAVYASISDIHVFDHPELVKAAPKFVPAPCISHTAFHVDGVLPHERTSGDMVITLRKA